MQKKAMKYSLYPYCTGKGLQVGSTKDWQAGRTMEASWKQVAGLSLIKYQRTPRPHTSQVLMLPLDRICGGCTTGNNAQWLETGARPSRENLKSRVLSLKKKKKKKAARAGSRLESQLLRRLRQEDYLRPGVQGCI